MVQKEDNSQLEANLPSMGMNTDSVDFVESQSRGSFNLHILQILPLGSSHWPYAMPVKFNNEARSSNTLYSKNRGLRLSNERLSNKRVNGF